MYGHWTSVVTYVLERQSYDQFSVLVTLCSSIIQFLSFSPSRHFQNLSGTSDTFRHECLDNLLQTKYLFFFFNASSVYAKLSLRNRELRSHGHGNA